MRMNEKVKLEDIINLDRNLELNGELIVFAWRTAEFYTGSFSINLSEGSKCFA